MIRITNLKGDTLMEDVSDLRRAKIVTVKPEVLADWLKTMGVKGWVVSEIMEDVYNPEYCKCYHRSFELHALGAMLPEISFEDLKDHFRSLYCCSRGSNV